MRKNDIIQNIARLKMVEDIVCNIAHKSIDCNLQDLSQMIYTILLEYDEELIVKLYNEGSIRFFITRIALNQYYSGKSQFYRDYKKIWDDISDAVIDDSKYDYDKDMAVTRIEDIINNRLSQDDRNMILAYMDMRSLSKLGEFLGVSKSLVKLEIDRIKDIIREDYGRYDINMGNRSIHR